MKNLILTSGHLGSTEKAGEILATLLNGDTTVISTASKPFVDFKTFDNVIFGTNVRMFRLNKNFKKYVKKYNKQSSNNAFCYVIAANAPSVPKYMENAKKLFENGADVVYAGGELNEENATGFALSVVKSVKAGFIKEGKPLPEIDKIALQDLANKINN